MAFTRRTALLSALGIGVASRLTIEPTLPVVPTADAGVFYIPEKIRFPAGWCAPSETLYNLAGPGYVDMLISLPEINVRRGCIRHGEQS